MKNLLHFHPEIKHFLKDQKIISPEISHHKSTVMNQHKSDMVNLNRFITKFSRIKSISPSSIRKLNELPNAQQYLINGLKYYPVPQTFLKRSKGLYLDLRFEKTPHIFSFRIASFIKKVKELPNPLRLKVNLNHIGHIPIQKIEDPLFNGLINTIWTLDVTKNPGLSIKDVMAKQMVDDALKDKTLSTSKIIVEGTSGNTGAGLAIVAAVYGIKTILIIPDKMSQEKIDRLSLLGAHVIVAPTKVAPNSPFSYYSVRDFVAREANGWKASQYHNLSNRKAHELVTGPEIWEQTKGKITTLIATAGTCGTVSGIAKYLKKKNSKIKVIAVDTMGSILYLLYEGYSIQEVEKYATSYTIQGFGEDIHPQNLDSKLIDQFVRVSDADGLYMTRYLPLIGFVAGQSSGAAYAALWRLVQKKVITESDNAVVIFPDTGIPYRKDVYSNQWIKKLGLGNIIY